ncbi:Bacterial-like globin [Promicromonospora umidemergens]|nr:Bacterial-like globin [Promicromonospora umidemergens]
MPRAELPCLYGLHAALVRPSWLAPAGVTLGPTVWLDRQTVMEKEPSLYDSLGGMPVLRRLSDALYERVVADESLAPVFANFNQRHVEHVAVWLARCSAALRSSRRRSAVTGHAAQPPRPRDPRRAAPALAPANVRSRRQDLEPARVADLALDGGRRPARHDRHLATRGTRISEVDVRDSTMAFVRDRAGRPRPTADTRVERCRARGCTAVRVWTVPGGPPSIPGPATVAGRPSHRCGPR